MFLLPNHHQKQVSVRIERIPGASGDEPRLFAQALVGEQCEPVGTRCCCRGGIGDGGVEPSARFPLWTRGNAGEVFPNVMTPLTFTVYGDAPRRGQTANFVESGFLTERDLTNGVAPLTRVFAGYLYINMSLGRLTGARMPGAKPEEIDTQIFGTSGAPPYQRRNGDRNLRATLGIMRFAFRTLRTKDTAFVDEAKTRAQTWLASLPNPPEASDAELLALVPTFEARIEQLFKVLLRASGIAAMGRSTVEQLLKRRFPDSSALLNRISAGLGDVVSALPARKLWDLGRIIAGDTSLTAEFDAGVNGLHDRLRSAETAAATRFVRQFDAFLVEHGRRGPDEYEFASPSWAMEPDLALAMINRLRLAPADRSPAEAATRLAVERDIAVAQVLRKVPPGLRGTMKRALHLCAIGPSGRERAKDVFILEVNGMRQVLDELLTRAAARGGPTAWRDGYLITADELPPFVADPAQFADIITTRSRQREYLQERQPPFWFEGTVSDPSTWPSRVALAVDAKPRTLTGLGVCGGEATGRARVVTSPGEPRGLEPGDVLVAPITDPAWTPLFLGACAVVVDVGAQLSHAAIVARELGVPCVVSVEGASRTIADGTRLHVNGDTGTVTVLA